MVPYLPSEIILNILSRLPARTIMSCKCVCKTWLDLLMTPEFVMSHHSISAPGLVTFEQKKTHSKLYKIVELVDEVDLYCHEHRWNVVFDFDLPFDEPLYTSANGLLFHNRESDGIFLCNPITREYIKLPSPPRRLSIETYGFGVSRMSGQYKLVRIFLDEILPLMQTDRFECQVYTVGTGSWRRIACGGRLTYKTMAGVFLNGNLHWLVYNGSSEQISCFDLETELFSAFSPPRHDHHKTYDTLSVLGDSICLCNISIGWPGLLYDIDIWLMKEYGDEKSWTKEFVFRKVYIDESLGCIYPIKVFKCGDILMQFAECKLLYYCSKTETLRVINLLEFDRDIISHTLTIYAPTFLPLKTFAMENVSSF